MPSSVVARQALAQLGKTPIHVPGTANRRFVSQLRRMPRRRQIEFNASNMAAALAASGQPVNAGR
jgi:hypothetical protein